MPLKTLKEVAEWYGVTHMTVKAWQTAGLPIHSRGRGGRPNILNTKHVNKWLIQREIEKRVPSGDGPKYDKAAEEARLKHHQANTEQIKQAELAGSMIPRDVVIETCSAAASNVKAKFMTVRSKVANRFPGVDDDVLESIEELHLEALAELGNSGIPNSLRERLERYTQELQPTVKADG